MGNRQQYLKWLKETATRGCLEQILKTRTYGRVFQLHTQHVSTQIVLGKRQTARRMAMRRAVVFSSRADWIRTSDLNTPSVARYQTTLQPEADSLR